jgi:hypothetical protein
MGNNYLKVPDDGSDVSPQWGTLEQKSWLCQVSSFRTAVILLLRAMNFISKNFAP